MSDRPTNPLYIKGTLWENSVDPKEAWEKNKELIKRMDSTTYRIKALKEDRDKWKSLAERLAGALTTIASVHKPRHSQEEYWISISHKQCATVLATDTKIAREALAEFENALENKNKTS